MRKLITLPPLFGVIALLGVSFTFRAAAVPGAEFTSTPGSGPPGTSISVSSITPCPPNPSGVVGPRVVRVTLSRGNARLGSAQLSVASSGTWSGHLTVASSATGGSSSLDAFCLSSVEAEGATLAYNARSFTVTTEAPTAPIASAPVAVTG